MAIARGVFSYNIGRQTSGNCPKKLFSTSTTTTTTSSKSKQPSKEDVHQQHQYHSETYGTDEKNPLSEPVSFCDNDLEEKFVRGSGPGGQKINKTSNCVELKHKHTGVIVRCQETRSLEKNREIARVRLLEKLKFMFTPKESLIQKKIDEKKKKKNDAERKRRLKEDAIKNRVDL